MINHSDIAHEDLIFLIKNKRILFAGYKRFKIYGTLDCISGKKKMKKENRVFFESEEEAIENDYRPCGFCMKDKYKIWKETKNEISSQ